THTVAPGDSLWAIAERVYGDGNQYQRIADANGIANPDLIHPGQVLTIP
ncbi:LysM peptidoglycan-binding domain-containing protein, partial [Rhodococcus sp. HM1]